MQAPESGNWVAGSTAEKLADRNRDPDHAVDLVRRALRRHRCAQAYCSRSRRLSLDPRGRRLAGHARHGRRRPRHGLACRAHRRQAHGDVRCRHDVRRPVPLVGRGGLAALRGARTSCRVSRQWRHQRTALCLHHPLVRASPRHRARPDRERAIRGRRRLAVAVRARDRRLRLAADHGGLRGAGGCADRAARRPGPASRRRRPRTSGPQPGRADSPTECWTCRPIPFSHCSRSRRSCAACRWPCRRRT